MYRDKLTELQQWKMSSMRKPLIVRGARQVGKTWLLKEFGKTAYKHFVYVNFEDSPHLQTLFKDDFNIKRIISTLEITTKINIIPEETLLIFDEIQAADRGVTVLKYFYENAPEYHVAAAGPLLGIAFHKHESFPVGKVDFLDLQPMSFSEFLVAIGEERLKEAIHQQDWTLLSVFKTKLNEILRYYFFVGGLPEVVQTYIETNDFQKVRFVQNRILLSYEGDFSKHAPFEIVPRIRMVWQSIVSQLAKENKKFIYGQIREGARAKDFELAIQWLTDAGLLVKCHRISKPEMPLIAFQDLGSFKLFLHDTGLLFALANIDIANLLNGDSLMQQYNGAIAVQFVIQQLRLKSNRFIGYWTNDRSTSEVDFVIQNEGKIIPIEVKSGENLRAKSFKLFCQKYNPDEAIRTSMADYKAESWMTNLPLWAIEII
ncbi:MAG: ATPase [Porphyromonadaceae bacterium CG2_30_38_12]|nr:MAG: ATPase [Porphyromonadaceae bacterium CG2_30_38_12]